MPRSLGSAALSDRISRFETDLRDAVWELALSVLQKEYVRRAAAAAPKSRKAKPTRGAAAKRSRPVARSAPRVKAVAAAAVEAAPPAPAAMQEPSHEMANGAPESATPARKGRPAWTKERVVEELGNWLIQDPVIDAATLTRRNQSALVAAARRLFGRFDAALNAANLHLAELYPDGPPSKRRAAA